MARIMHEVPPLPYAYGALEPYIDEETLHLHHDKHHAAYVKGLNAAEEEAAEMLKSGDYAGVRALSGDLAFNGSGHILHSLYWKNMKPGGGGNPEGKLADTLKEAFESIEAFKSFFIATANKVQGSGWGILAYRKMDDDLVVLGAEKHENLTQWGGQPILVVDVWEHAYYLKYQNKREEYIKAFVDHLINWGNVAENLEAARAEGKILAGVK